MAAAEPGQTGEFLVFLDKGVSFASHGVCRNLNFNLSLRTSIGVGGAQVLPFRLRTALRKMITGSGRFNLSVKIDREHRQTLGVVFGLQPLVQSEVIGVQLARVCKVTICGYGKRLAF